MLTKAIGRLLQKRDLAPITNWINVLISLIQKGTEELKLKEIVAELNLTEIKFNQIMSLLARNKLISVGLEQGGIRVDIGLIQKELKNLSLEKNLTTGQLREINEAKDMLINYLLSCSS